MHVKVRRVLVLDSDLVEAFDGRPAALSAHVNAVLRRSADVSKVRREELDNYVDELVDTFGEPAPHVRASVAVLLDKAEVESSNVPPPEPGGPHKGSGAPTRVGEQ